MGEREGGREGGRERGRQGERQADSEAVTDTELDGINTDTAKEAVRFAGDVRWCDRVRVRGIEREGEREGECGCGMWARDIKTGRVSGRGRDTKRHMNT